MQETELETRYIKCIPGPSGHKAREADGDKYADRTLTVQARKQGSHLNLNGPIGRVCVQGYSRRGCSGQFRLIWHTGL